jgi:hypothetical protein
MLLSHILIIQFFLNFNYKLFNHHKKKVGYGQVSVNHHTTTLQYSIQRKPKLHKFVDRYCRPNIL